MIFILQRKRRITALTIIDDNYILVIKESVKKLRKRGSYMNRYGYRMNGWKRYLLAMLAVLAVFFSGFTEITAFGAFSTQGTVSGSGDFVIWTKSSIAEMWITEIYAGQSDILDRITFVDYSGTYLDEFFEDLEAVLPDPEDPLFPDIIFLEPDYAPKFQEAFLSAEDLGITQADMSNMFPYTIDNGTDSQGAVRTFYITAEPGAYQVRADLAERYLGTSDPEELHDLYFSDWKKMMATARRVYRESNGMVALLPGYGELYAGQAMTEQDFSWVDKNNIPADAEQIARMMRFTQGFEKYTLGTEQWSMAWMDAMSGDGVRTQAAIAFAGSPWFTGYCLTESWYNNTVIVQGPVDFQWGGNGLAATTGCSDISFAADIIRTLCCDTDAMTQLAGLGEYVNNREAIDSASGLGYGKCDFLFAQDKDLFQAYLPLAENNTEGDCLTAYNYEMDDLYFMNLEQYITQGGGMEESMQMGEEIREALEEMIASD